MGTAFSAGLNGDGFFKWVERGDGFFDWVEWGRLFQMGLMRTTFSNELNRNHFFKRVE
jgi:hypothetical protein